MIILAAALTLGINVELDLGSLIQRLRGPKASPVATCGIKTVGYHFTGKPGQTFQYAGETFTLPLEGYVEVISLPKLTTFSVDGKTLPLDGGAGELDGFSFRWIDLSPTTAATTGGMQ